MENNAKLIKFIIEGIIEKKGKEIVHVNLEKLNYAPCENFIICHGDTGIQSRSLAESVERKVKDNLDVQLWHREGMDVAKWILLDYGIVVVHIFQKETREYYKLEELWGDAEMFLISDEFK
ncbi:MAG: ribosome silencing factor [Bacteroidales bacterium]|nr:ribosome silencing factor [Bacteroidales bacterium]